MILWCWRKTRICGLGRKHSLMLELDSLKMKVSSRFLVLKENTVFVLARKHGFTGFRPKYAILVKNVISRFWWGKYGFGGKTWLAFLARKHNFVVLIEKYNFSFKTLFWWTNTTFHGKCYFDNKKKNFVRKTLFW